MKTKLLTFIFIALQLGTVCQTQMDLNNNANKEAQNADQQLTDVYNKILQEYSTDTFFIKNLKAAQNIWVNFREAEMNMKFPDYQNYYGSILPMCKSEYYTQLTNERVNTLKVWLNGIEEGDGCAGSVKAVQ